MNEKLPEVGDTVSFEHGGDWGITTHVSEGVITRLLGENENWCAEVETDDGGYFQIYKNDLR